MLDWHPMKALLSVPLNGTPDQVARLRALQGAFADVCNAIAPIVQSTRCWNRVALHHLVYRPMRERFPALGSQMICNAIYSVSRTARLVLQHPASPFNIAKQPPNAPLPLFRFAPTAPVYFDRHTLSVKGNALSMFTLDGRIRFNLQLQPAEIARFHTEKLLEIVLSASPQGYRLTFQFAGNETTGLGAGVGDDATAAETRQLEQPNAADRSEVGSSKTGDAATLVEASAAKAANAAAFDTSSARTAPGASDGSLPEYLVVIPPEAVEPAAIEPALTAERSDSPTSAISSGQHPAIAIQHS